MGFIKYFIVGFLAVGLFVGGAFFMRLSEQKDSFLGNKGKSNFSQTLTIQKQIPIELYVGAFGFRATQKSELSAQEKQLIKNTLSTVIERARKDRNCEGGNFDLRPSNMGEQGSLPNDEKLDLRGVIECKFSKDEFKDYQTMLKDIDYITLKSGVIRLANYGIEPIITQEQLNLASKEVYSLTSQEIKQQKSAIESGFSTKCEVGRVEFFDDSHKQDKALQGHHSVALGIARDGLYSSIESSLDDFALPLQSTKSVEFKSYISFQCK